MAPTWLDNGVKASQLATAKSIPLGNGFGEDVQLLMPEQPQEGKNLSTNDRLGRLSRKSGQMGHRPSESGELDPADAYEDVSLMPKSGPSSKWIIMPQSKFRKRWVQVTLFVAMYIIWITPYRVGFDIQAQGPWFWIEGVIDIFFWVDLILNFFTAYENPVTSEVITNHKLIAQRYLTSWFWIDLLATFPSDYIVKGLEGTWSCSFHNNCEPFLTGNTAVSVIVLLRTTRVFRIIWIFKNFNILSISNVIGRAVDQFIAVRWVFSIAELFAVLLFLGHLCGCFFYMFSHPRWQTPVERELVAAGDMTTWVLDKTGGYDTVQLPTLVVPNNHTVFNVSKHMAQDNNGQWYECPELYYMEDCNECHGSLKLRCVAELGSTFRYISAMYWAYTTMTTVGYGDIYATTIAEKIWAMMTMVIGGFFLSFCFGRIASIVSKLDADRAARSDQLESLTQFLIDHEVPKSISHKVLDFFNTNVKSVKPYDRAMVLARMPFDLRSKILQHLYDTCIKNIPLLHRICLDDQTFMADFTIKLQPYHTTPETFIYQKGELATDMWILIRGLVHVVDSDKRTPLVRIPEGTIFGEAGLVEHLQGQNRFRRNETVKCATACDMLRLGLDEALELCEVYPELAKGLKRVHKARQTQLRRLTSDGGASNHPNSLPAIAAGALASSVPDTVALSPVIAATASSLPVEDPDLRSSQIASEVTIGPTLGLIEETATLNISSDSSSTCMKVESQDVTHLKGLVQELQGEVASLQQSVAQQQAWQQQELGSLKQLMIRVASGRVDNSNVDTDQADTSMGIL